MDTANNIEIVKTTIVDSIEYVKKSDVLQFYSDIADKQASQFTILISVLCGIVVVLFGATWWWNYRAARQQIKDDINTEKESLTRLLRKKLKEFTTTIEKQQNDFKSQKGTFQKSINNQIDAKYKQLDADIESTMNKHRNELVEKINEHKKSVEKQLKRDQSELNRIFALHCDSTNLYYIASTWWLSAAEKYKDLGEEYALGICISGMKDTHEKCKESELDNIEIEEMQSQIERVNRIVPDIIKKEKDSIIKKMNELIKLKQKE